MPSHQKDRWGYAADPELNRLETQLSMLAGMWRSAYGDPVHQAEIVREYHETLKILERLGWKGIIDLDAQLPIDLMPEGYRPKQDPYAWMPIEQYLKERDNTDEAQEIPNDHERRGWHRFSIWLRKWFG